MRCPDVTSRIELFFLGELEAPEALEIKNHLETCEDCKNDKQVEANKSFQTALESHFKLASPQDSIEERFSKRLSAEPPITAQTKQRLKIWWIASAAAVLLVAITLVLMTQNHPEQLQHIQIVSGDVQQRGFQVVNVSQAPAKIKVYRDVAIELASQSELELRPQTNLQRVYLARGSATFHIPSRPEQFSVKTSVGEIIVHGTEFKVELEKINKIESMTVSVVSGMVQVTNARGKLTVTKHQIVFADQENEPIQLDEMDLKKLEQLLKNLDDDTPSKRETAQKELKEFLDTDAKVNFLLKHSKKYSAEVQFQVSILVRQYEGKKIGRIAYLKEVRVTKPRLDVHRYLYIANCDGEEGEQLTKDGYCKGCSWSPDGKQIAYVLYVKWPSKGGIYVMDIASKKTKLIEGSDIYSIPIWSPDGKKIAFSGMTGKTTGDPWMCLFIKDLISGELKSIFKCKNSGGPNIAWSPDGKKLVFTGLEGARASIVNSDGTDLRTIEGGDGISTHISGWSPDGKKILYSMGSDRRQQIFVTDSEGKNLRQLTEDDVASAKFPVWSPNGKQIAFLSGITSSPDPQLDRGYNVFVIDSDGRNLKKLTEDDAWYSNLHWVGDNKLFCTKKTEVLLIELVQNGKAVNKTICDLGSLIVVDFWRKK